MRLLKNSSWLLMLITICLLTACGQSPKSASSSASAPTEKPKTVLKPVIIEVILPKDETYNDQLLADIKWPDEYGAETNVWKNHITVYLMLPDTIGLMKYMKRAIHGKYNSVKVYADPFYNFKRKMCKNTITSKEWTNILLTANLVADTKMQQKYLDYHKTQFQKWPEVSKGFCNASFQQLLVFKNGRQLMLLISIPKGKTLDELNPLTTKNNPRVNDWNKLMSKYQEGLPGTKKGETWVFLKPLSDNK